MEKKIQKLKKRFKYNENLEIYYSRYHPLNLDDLKKKPVVALAGIANPDNFFDLIEKIINIHKNLYIRITINLVKRNF